MRVLVAGDPGSIGPVLTPILRSAAHGVDGLDSGPCEGRDLGPLDDDASGRAPGDAGVLDDTLRRIDVHDAESGGLVPDLARA